MAGPGTPSIADVMAIRPALALAAQRVHDDWSQDQDGHDEELGAGGICHLIADAIVGEISERLPDIEATAETVNDEVHVLVVLAVAEGVYSLDIPHRLYERGSAYEWRKVPDVRFGAGDVELLRLSTDPAEVWMYQKHGESSDGPRSR